MSYCCLFRRWCARCTYHWPPKSTWYNGPSFSDITDRVQRFRRLQAVRSLPHDAHSVAPASVDFVDRTDMHKSAVRRSFLARRTGQSPATAAAGPLSQHGQGAGATLGAAAEASWTENDLTASSQTVALLAAQEASAEGVVNNGQHALMKAALSADEGDLPSLSLVLDMALSILFARAAIVNLLSHVRAAINGSPQCPPRARGLFSVGPAEPKRSWWWVQPRRTEGGGCLLYTSDAADE